MTKRLFALKTSLTLLVCLICFSSFAQSQATGNGAYIEFTKRRHDTGTLQRPWQVTVTYEFRNTGDAPLMVQNVTTDCGCTVADYTRKPVKPGKKGIVKVSFDGTHSGSGYFHKTITVVTNSWRKPIDRLYLEGNRSE